MSMNTITTIMTVAIFSVLLYLAYLIGLELWCLAYGILN